MSERSANTSPLSSNIRKPVGGLAPPAPPETPGWPAMAPAAKTCSYSTIGVQTSP
jgi:hypothetical protein